MAPHVLYSEMLMRLRIEFLKDGPDTVIRVDGDLQADGVEVDFSGGGRALLRGTVADQSISISGAGSYEAADLRTETARVRVSGAGTAVLWVTEALDVDISGLGSVRYYGDPVVSRNVSGLGSVESLGSRE